MQRLALQSIGIALTAAIASAAVNAQSSYPAKPITLVVAFAAGDRSPAP